MNDELVKSTHFHQALRKNMFEAKGGRKDEIDVLRTAFWFTEIKARLDAASAYEVEHILELAAFGKNKYGDPYHRNKWSRYEVGKHVPSDALVNSVDAKLPGTKHILNHVLWAVLQAKDGIKECADDWLRQLSPDIQKLIFRTNRYNPQNAPRRIILSRTLIKKLERRAGIDALACLTVLLLEPCILEDQDLAFELGSSLYRVLLILSTAVPVRGFYAELLDIFLEKVFSKVRRNGLRFRFEDFDFSDAIFRLALLILQLEESGKIGFEWEDSVEAMCKLLDGDYGIDVKFALDPPIGPDEPPSDANVEAYRKYERVNRYRKWGNEQMFSKNREMLPPHELSR